MPDILFVMLMAAFMLSCLRLGKFLDKVSK
jgi:hypothetical protein